MFGGYKIPEVLEQLLSETSTLLNLPKNNIVKRALIFYLANFDVIEKRFGKNINYLLNVVSYIGNSKKFKEKIENNLNIFKLFRASKEYSFSKLSKVKSLDLDELENLDVDNVKDIKKYVKSLLVKYFGYESYRDLYEQKLEYVIKILKTSVYSISDIFTILTKFFNDYLDYSSKIYSFHYQLLSELDEIRKKLENKDLKLSDLPILTNKLSNVIEKLRKYFEVVYNIVDRLENVYTFVSEFIEKDEKKRILFEFLKLFDIENIENLEIVMNEHKKVKNEIFTRKRIGNRNIFNSE